MSKSCQECGMSVEPGQYHPLAACLMFKQSGRSTTAEANLQAVREFGAAGERTRIRSRLRGEISGWMQSTGASTAQSERGIGARAAMADILDALERICPEDGKPTTCTWTQQDHEGGDSWETDCGNAFWLDGGPPSENSMRFCCYCGRPLAEKRFEPEPEPEEEGVADAHP